MKNIAATLARSANGLFFPPACAACEAALSDDASEFCTGCLAEMPLIERPRCLRCGAPVAAEFAVGQSCPHCAKHSFRFDSALALGVYEGLLRRLVLAAKEIPGENIAAALGRALAGAVRESLPDESIDVVASIPMHWQRRLLRRHNPTEAIGQALAGQLGLPFAPNLLRLTRAKRKQAELATTQRQRNMRGAFALSRGHVLRGATVLIVDDILTTGATCSDASRALKSSGTARVVAVVAARSL